MGNVHYVTASIVFYVVVVMLVFILCLNYYFGKQFHRCRTCKPNEVFLVKVPDITKQNLDTLLSTMKTRGRRLKKEKNFNNSQGSKLTYSQLPEEIKTLYDDDEELRQAVSRAVGENVSFADPTDEHRIFSRMYIGGDFMKWHYDNNFTVGHRYTLVIPVLVDPGNTSEFWIRDRKTSGDKRVPIPVGKGVVYDGTSTYHSISPQRHGKRRLVIIIPFYSDYRKNVVGKIREWIRNVTFRQLTL